MNKIAKDRFALRSLRGSFPVPLMTLMQGTDPMAQMFRLPANLSNVVTKFLLMPAEGLVELQTKSTLGTSMHRHKRELVLSCVYGQCNTVDAVQYCGGVLSYCGGEGYHRTVW